MPYVIGDYQNALIKGRQILNGVFIANKIINHLKRRKPKGYLLKLDFHKAFDSVIWEYLDEVMACTGFGSRWREWIHQCISTAKIYVLVIGSPTEEFFMEKGLHQRDFLLPFLFNIVAEELIAEC
jgi:hypothetical protein